MASPTALLTNGMQLLPFTISTNARLSALNSRLASAWQAPGVGTLKTLETLIHCP